MNTFQHVVGVRFQANGRIFYFDAGGLPLKLNDWVVAEPYKGAEVGRVVIAPGQILGLELTEPLRPVLRLATDQDVVQMEDMRKKGEEAFCTFREMIGKLDLPMRPLEAEYALDGSRVTLFFAAEGRVDFRQLLHDLTASLDTWVELRQVADREAAKLTGGYGICGRPLCCSTFLPQLGGVTIRMMRTQDLPRAPEKLTGTCGRLMCCVAFENQVYEEQRAKMPLLGAGVLTRDGFGQVVNILWLKETAMVRLESSAVIEVPVAELKRVGA